MKQRFLCLLAVLAMLLPCTLSAQTVNLTPKPKAMTVGEGSLPLTQGFTVACNGLDDEMATEVANFISDINAATGLNAHSATGGTGLITVTKQSAGTTANGGYALTVTTSGATISAPDALSLFYALQTVKKILPPNVMAVVNDPAVTSYALPVVTITDEPRFQYRGFMLDVSRHFFSVAEIKRVLDVMSYYKLNKFHWHLTDDQGWRAEIKKYPKLTTIGATAPNSRFTSLKEAKAYWINKPYGPYFYTQDQMREVVAYAKKLHIDVIPEVDMPGHFAAAMTAYPEFSCTPNGSHRVWDNGGISYDILNVANPKAMQFIYDVVDELCGIFPYESFNIGGDECPTDWWKSNADCQALYNQLGLSDWRGLQSWFISKVDSAVKAHGKHLVMWNESITASGADLDKMKATDAAILCWSPADQAVERAHSLGLKSVYTPWGPYYINRKQGNGPKDPPGAADGSDHVRATYNKVIPANVDYGVQGTFWCEWVSDSTYMEWLALPRLIAIAEAGWTPQANRNFDDFIARVAKDTVMLNYHNYYYCTYYMPGSEQTQQVMPHANADGKQYYYRIISGGTDVRKGRCFEVVRDGSPLLNTYASNNIAVNRVWTNDPAASGDANYDYQWWSLEADPAGSGKYALVCKALPNGSINPNATAADNSARWNYDPETKNYNFILGTGAYGKKGDNYYYSITSDKVASGWYMNSSMPGQGLAVNLWNDPNSGNGGQWEFSPMEKYDGGDDPQPVVTFDQLKQDQLYSFTNAVDGFDATALTDDGTSATLTHSTDPFAANAWKVVSSTANSDGTQTVTLQNETTGRSIATAGTFVDRLGSPVSMGTAANLTLAYQPENQDLRLMVGGKSLFPLPSGLVYAGSNYSNSEDAPRGQGAEWKAQQVKIVTFVCTDDQGGSLGTFKRSVATDATVTQDLCPTFKNNVIQSMTAAANDTYNVTYRRSAYAITFNATDDHGCLIETDEVAAPVGQAYTVKLPTPAYYTLKTSDVADGTSITPTADQTINVVYTTDALTGVKRDGNVVTTLEPGKYYLMYDASSDAARVGYRLAQDNNNVNRANAAENLRPTAVWTLEGSGSSYKVKNVGKNLYVPQLRRSQATTLAGDGDTFTFALNGDGTTWKITGTNGQMWDGVESGNLVGWNSGSGHPIRITTFYAQPVYTVTITCVSNSGAQLSQTVEYVNAGEEYALNYPSFNGYTLVSVQGAEGYTGKVEGFMNITANYSDSADGISVITKPEANAANQLIYDLSGRRVSRPHHGVYIQGGKKIVK